MSRCRHRVRWRRRRVDVQRAHRFTLRVGWPRTTLMMRSLVADRCRRVTLRCQFVDRSQGRWRPDTRIVITRRRRWGNSRSRCRWRTVLCRVRATLVRRGRRTTAAATANFSAASGNHYVHLFGRILKNVAGLLKSDAAQSTAIDVDDFVADLQSTVPGK